MAGKRRKVDDEGRTFQSAWTEKYFFVEHYSKPVCLICQTSIAVMKEFNVKRSGGSWLSLMVGPAKQLLKCQKVPFIDYLNSKAG